MKDWEDAILIRQDSQADECTNCPHKGEKCKSQCMEIKSTYNPYLIFERRL